jgi:hypothetical protein
MSTGCIVLQYPAEFTKLRAELTGAATTTIPGSARRSYGTIDVLEEIRLPPLLVPTRGNRGPRLVARQAASGRSWSRRLGRVGLFALAVLLLAGMGLRVLSTTQLGFIVADAIPAAVWRSLDAMHGPADGESALDTEAIALALVSLVAAIVCVSAATLLFVGLRRKTEKGGGQPR